MDMEQYKGILLRFAEWLSEQGYLNIVNFDFDWNENHIERTENITSVEAVQEYLLSGEIMGTDFISKK